MSCFDFIINYLVALFFVILALVYFIINFISKNTISEENTIVGLFSVLSVALCFVFNYLGFIDPVIEALVPWPYLFLCYSGNKASLKILYRKYKGRSDSFNKLYNYYITSTIIFFILILTNIALGIALKNNLILMICNLYIPIYCVGIMVANCYYLIIEKRFFIETIISNYMFVATSISLYELLDFTLYIWNIKLYPNFEYFYPDPTRYFDIFWILGNILIFIAIPRIRFSLIREEKKQ